MSVGAVPASIPAAITAPQMIGCGEHHGGSFHIIVVALDERAARLSAANDGIQTFRAQTV